MLSKQAFNGLLKTLEEPPPHVKFVFATTEIRKVPVTVLSRCQRFDLRRIEAEELVTHLDGIAQKENVKIERDALALIARAAEGSVRDALSLMDQAIAHGEDETITADLLRTMLGLVDRGRVLDLFEKVMGGKIADALADLAGLYDHGADPLAVMQDLLETVHFLTRIKVAPGAEGFFDGGSAEAKRAADMAAKLPVPALTRAWQLLLKGLLEVRDATRPVAAAEMALIRLAYAADLPPTDKLVRDVLENGGSASRGASAPTGGNGPRAQAPISQASAQAPRANTQTASAPASAPRAEVHREAHSDAGEQTAPALHTLQDVAALAAANNAPILRVQIENNMRLVRLEPGVLEFCPTPGAPRTLSGDLGQKLREWTGARWLVTIARDGGAPTIAESRRADKAAKLESVAQEPLVRAVLDRFPGAEIVAVHDLASDDMPVTEAPPESDSGDSDSDNS